MPLDFSALEAELTRDNDVKVEFTVRVPSGANLAARTVNGGIEARDLDGRVEVSTVNGSVDLGRSQQLFAVDYADMESFFQDEASPPLTLSSIARGSEFMRFLVAQAIALFLTLAGLGLEWMVVRAVVA